MRMRIDEAWRHHEAVRVDGAFAALAHLADFGDLAARDRDVGLVARLARAVDDEAVPDDEIVAHPALPEIVGLDATRRRVARRMQNAQSMFLSPFFGGEAR